MMDWNEAQYLEQISGGKPVLVEFHAPWCVYCRRIGPALERVARENRERVTVGRVNIDDFPALARREQIEVVPTLILWHRGEALGSIVAPESKAKIDEFLDDFLGS